MNYVAHCGDYYKQDYVVSVDRRLKRCPYGQCGIVNSNGNEFLISYATKVAEIDCDGWLHVYGLFSATTRKHISFWLREHNIPYSIAKGCVEDDMEYNVFTGEYRDASDGMIQTVGCRKR